MAPKGSYDHHRNVRRNNGKFVSNGSNPVTEILAAGKTTQGTAVGDSGSFTIRIGPAQ